MYVLYDNIYIYVEGTVR